MYFRLSIDGVLDIRWCTDIVDMNGLYHKCRGFSGSSGSRDGPLWRPPGVLPVRSGHVFQSGGVTAFCKLSGMEIPTPPLPGLIPRVCASIFTVQENVPFDQFAAWAGAETKMQRANNAAINRFFMTSSLPICRPTPHLYYLAPITPVKSARCSLKGAALSGTLVAL